ncbi:MULTISPECIES: ABC transporter ATP-binding protein [Jeotgalicoccus]|jgi:ABC-type antimicrobial peptide transport system, ATPase component|uniref:Putative hemin import ATP-binding protein HrtA n=1 Tax=Jeotgalicoccus nanhaiensis TaxID=568603 RepID=A0ABR9XXW8_9STAP|nr:ABC transporter ATP-binding protein [Jeotgalicoccus nanhaiensis]MBF0753854.1 ABC transporter ATP-binding protein [Jeotgalicoccus nanhaiensis]TFU62015.1 ABC transporter ATP-binding protein [Jeotgalicoccus nanhaiensis]
MLKFENVIKSFKDGDQTIEAVKNTSITFNKGECIAIIGPSGSGKSTFLTIAGALQTPTEGDVKINGQSISGMNSKELAHLRLNEIGFILQASNLVPFLSVKQQFQLLKKSKKDVMADSELDELFEKLSLKKVKDQLPSEISGGQKQRVAIAKSLYTNPSIILADEPTASLDTENALKVMQILKEETEQRMKTCIIVTHDERLTEYCDAVYKMTDGILEKQD